MPFDKISGPPLFIVGGRNPGHLADNVRNIKECVGRGRIVAIGGTREPGAVLKALEAGADGYLHEELTLETLVMALELVVRGETVLPSIDGNLLAEYVAAKSQVTFAHTPKGKGAEPPFIAGEAAKRNHPGLSTRQVAILHALVDGTPNKVIAQQLNVSEATVKLHVKAVLRKINVRNRTQAAVWAMKQASNGSISSYNG
jgi:two-component system nitrate/nitrite response regulator NarL